MKALTAVGARPQFVKAFAVSRALREGRRLEEKPSPYGDEIAAESIVEVLGRAR